MRSRQRRRRSRRRRSSGFSFSEGGRAESAPGGRAATGACSARLTVGKAAAKRLRTLVEQGGLKPKGGHKEVGCLLRVSPTGPGSFEAALPEHETEGHNDGVNVPDEKCGHVAAHTHPVGEYDVQEVDRAWPSGRDYVAVAERARAKGFLAHLVASREGLYCVSVSGEALRPGAKIPGDDRIKALYKRKLPKASGRPRVPTRASSDPLWDYLLMTRAIEPKDRVFDVEFRRWDELPSFTVRFAPRGENRVCDPAVCRK